MVHTFLYIYTLCLMLHLNGRTAFEIDLSNLVDDPDIHRNVSELISSKGYPVEEHTVQTADGYLLSVQRIPHGKINNVNAPDKEAILLIHGLFGDATQWVINFPDQSLGFALADRGYDVWLLNTRGCSYSKKHIKYTTNQYQFWDFSFNEMGQYDVPATIDYILKSTGKEYLYVIGHSQGTAAVFVMLSEMPDYNEKIKLFIAFAPVAFVHHLTSPVIKVIIPFASEIALALRLMHHGEFLPNSSIAKLVILASVELDVARVNQTRIGVYAAHCPSSTSEKCCRHFAQLVKSEKFRKFDYGHQRNVNIYHQKEPPDYDISRITAPVGLFWSTNDALIHPKDVELLKRNLSSLVFDYCVPEPYSHLDYVVALNAPQLIHKHVINLLAKY